jgi:crotonobetainyl-CoA:carnitine CoA-transferase CaiB-like acyl-CoA transferase
MVSGPMRGKVFSDMGAEVIKIEPPGAGGFSPAGTAIPVSLSLASEFPHAET